MPVTADQVATFRAYLAGDFELHRQLWERLDKTAAETGYVAMVAAGFFEAVDRRFVKNETIAQLSEVIEFIGDVRSRTDDLAQAIDPSVAERLIRHSLGYGSIADLDSDTKTGTQFLLLTALIADEGLDDTALDEFVAEVREVAEDWTR